MEEKKSIEVVTGDGSNLDITPVYNHLEAESPKAKKEKPKNIVIPKSQKENSKETNKKSEK